MKKSILIVFTLFITNCQLFSQQVVSSTFLTSYDLSYFVNELEITFSQCSLLMYVASLYVSSVYLFTPCILYHALYLANGYLMLACGSWLTPLIGWPVSSLSAQCVCVTPGATDTQCLVIGSQRPELVSEWHSVFFSSFTAEVTHSRLSHFPRLLSTLCKHANIFFLYQNIQDYLKELNSMHTLKLQLMSFQDHTKKLQTFPVHKANCN